MKPILITAFAVCTAMAFGVPGVPDVPDADIPEIEIPRMELLDEVQRKLDGPIAQTDTPQTVLQRYAYAYDPAGNRTVEQIDDAITRPANLYRCW